MLDAVPVAPLSLSERRATAHHEAGHVVAFLELDIPLISVTAQAGSVVEPNTKEFIEFAGLITYDMPVGTMMGDVPEPQRLDHVVQALCGPLAEELSQKHRRRKKSLMAETNERDGKSISILLWSMFNTEEAWNEAFDKCYARAAQILKDHWPEVQKQERDEMTRDEIIALLEWKLNLKN